MILEINYLFLIFLKADYLADRIAIIAKGSLKCCGSPLYLKSISGTEYTLALTIKDGRNKEESNLMTNKIEQLIKDIVPNSKLVSNLNSELRFLLGVQTTSNYTDLFERLEKSKNELNIDNFGVNFTTMEKVFLKYL